MHALVLLAQAEAEVTDDATVFSRIGWLVAVVLIVGFLIGAFIVMRQARPELGSEIELAANRKPYYEDDELETKRLDRVLFFGDRKSTRLNSSHLDKSRLPSSA